MNLDQKSSLKACLEEEKDNPRMKDYVKILDTPNISAFEWIHRVQEELMDGIVYLEKLREILKMNMRELDAARLAAMKETENKVTGTEDEEEKDENEQLQENKVEEDEETIEININVPAPEGKDISEIKSKETIQPSDNKPKKKKIKITKPKTTN
jgi:hypothetical protein